MAELLAQWLNDEVSLSAVSSLESSQCNLAVLLGKTSSCLLTPTKLYFANFVIFLVHRK